MVRSYIALITIIALMGMCSPALAGDLVSPKLLPGSSRTVRHNIPATIAAFSMPEGAPEAGQAPSTAPKPASAGGRHWSKKGKILTGFGVGAAAAGAIMMTRQDSDLGNGTTINWKATGALWLSVGAVLTIVGLTRRSD